MEIKILHHPSDETAARKIGKVLNDNGISSQLTDSGLTTNGVHITVTTVTKPSEKTKEVSLLTSSFVHLDTKPGY